MYIWSMDKCALVCTVNEFSKFYSKYCIAIFLAPKFFLELVLFFCLLANRMQLQTLKETAGFYGILEG